MKKTVIILFCSFLLMFGGMTFDYFMNEKSVSVDTYTTTANDIQENFQVSGDIIFVNNVNYITGTIKKPMKIEEGAQAFVTLNDKMYDGYLQTLTKKYSDVYEAVISIVSDVELSGKATVQVYGDVLKDVIMVPYSCVFTDDDGNDAVMVSSSGYCVKRNVLLGEINTQDGTQIKKGVLDQESVIVNPNNLKTGDKIDDKYD